MEGAWNGDARTLALGAIGASAVTGQAGSLDGQEFGEKAFAMGRPILAAEARRVDGQKEFAAARGAASAAAFSASMSAPVTVTPKCAAVCTMALRYDCDTSARPPGRAPLVSRHR